MTPRTILVTVLGLLTGAAVALTLAMPPRTDLPKNTTSQGQARIGGPFTLTSTQGGAVTDQTYLGSPLLVYFGFTHCPDICPAGLQIISAALDKLGDKAAKIAPLFITLDPERDTVAKLGAYVQSFHHGIVGLTGTLEQTAAAAKTYRVYAKKVPSGTAPGEYSIDHSGFMYLMDARGKFVTHFPHNVSADKLASALTETLAKN